MYKAIVILKTGGGKKTELYLKAYSFDDACEQLKKNEEISQKISLIKLEGITES